MLSRRPYLLRAIYAWLVDSNDTPFLLINASEETIEVPAGFVKDDKIILNIGATAVGHLDLGNDAIRFSGRFDGVSRNVTIPMDAVMAIYGRDSGRGIMFGQDDDNPHDEKDKENGANEHPPRGKPRLEVIK